MSVAADVTQTLAQVLIASRPQEQPCEEERNAFYVCSRFSARRERHSYEREIFNKYLILNNI